jgi:hypothetical protein
MVFTYCVITTELSVVIDILWLILFLDVFERSRKVFIIRSLLL